MIPDCDLLRCNSTDAIFTINCLQVCWTNIIPLKCHWFNYVAVISADIMTCQLPLSIICKWFTDKVRSSNDANHRMFNTINIVRSTATSAANTFNNTNIQLLKTWTLKSKTYQNYVFFKLRPALARPHILKIILFTNIPKTFQNYTLRNMLTSNMLGLHC